MIFDGLSKLTKASQAASGYLTKKWEEKKAQDAAKAEAVAAEAARLEAERVRNEKIAFLGLVAAKITGTSAFEMPPLEYDLDTTHRAVFLVTVPIAYGAFELSKKSYNLLARHFGMSLNSVSHWAVCVIDRGPGTCWSYDLMSDQLALAMLGKNYFRAYEILPEFIESWSSCYYVGETTRSHEEIQALGASHMALNPRYHLLDNNCQHLVETLVKELCDGRLISQAKLSEELSLVSPKIARDLMVARLRSKLDVKGEKEDSKDVEDDVDIIKGLWSKVRHRSPGDGDHKDTQLVNA